MSKTGLTKQALAKQDASALLYECSMLAHVRVTGVEVKKGRVYATLALIQTLPAGFEEMLRSVEQEDDDVSVQFSIELTLADTEADYWGIAEVGMNLYFDPELVTATVDFCNQLPQVTPLDERRCKCVRFLAGQVVGDSRKH